MEKKSRRLLSVFLSLFTLLCVMFMCGISASAEDMVLSGSCGDNLTYVLDSDGVLTISGTGAMENWYNSSSVPWLSNAKAIKSVVIGSGVTSIGDYAFRECGGLTSITISDSLTSIGSRAFYHCIGLTSITIPDSVTRIGDCAFDDCTGLTSITIPGSVTSISWYAFDGCTGLTSITIPAGVTSIGSSAFDGCSRLASITFAEGSQLTRIDSYAFWGCSSLTSITIPAGVTSIGSDAFDHCYSLVEVCNLSPLSITAGRVDNGDVAHYAKNVYTGSSGTSILFNVGDFVFMKWKESNYLVKYIGTDTDITLPAAFEHNGTMVTGYEIYNYAFYYCSSLTSITIPDSVTRIGYCAFYGCSSLASITIPDSVTSIDSYAFRGCSSLASFTIPDSVTSIGGGAFEDCTSLATINIPASVTSIAVGIFYNPAFSGCSALTSINVAANNAAYSSDARGVLFNKDKTILIHYPAGNTETSYSIPNSVRLVDEHAFRSCNNLARINIPAGVTRIGGYAFDGCSSLASITIPDSVTSIDSYAFRGCSSLASITIPDSVTSIGGSAFFGCSSLTSITIPDSVTSIGSSAFYDCSRLAGITFAEGSPLTRIGGYAFDGCSSLASINIPSGVTSIGYQAFRGCSSLASITIPAGVTSIDQSTFDGCSSLASVTFAENSQLISIDRSAFEHCTSLTSIAIPDSVTSIGNSAFDGCSSLASITFAEGSLLTSIGYSTFYGCSSLTSITIPAGVTSIGDSAFDGCSSLASITFAEGSLLTSIASMVFYGCSSLASITIPAGVTSIDQSTFKGCSSLASITFAEGSQLTRIDSYAFWGCSSLTSITIPAGVTSIGGEAFKYCYSLTSITIPDSVTRINSRAFYYCISLTSVTIPAGVTSIGNQAFQGCSSLTSITIPDSVTSIGSSAFEDCSSLASITIPDSVTSIGGGAFEDCTSLATINIPDSVTSINNCAFWNCSSLTSITIPAGVTSIGNQAFQGCSSFASITIPDSVTSIGGSAFKDCSSLASIIIPAGVTSIGSSAFAGCSSLTSVTFAENSQLTRIGEDAFSGCSSLTSITIPDSVTYIGSFAFNGCSLEMVVMGDGLTAIPSTLINTDCLKKFVIGNSVTRIDNFAFRYCSSLTSITIPAGVTFIGSEAFYYCSSLTSITIPDSVTIIGYAFKNCDSLTDIYYTGTQTQWQAIKSDASIPSGATIHYNSIGQVKMSITPGPLHMKVGNITQPVIATVRKTDGSMASNQSGVTWSSSDNSVARVVKTTTSDVNFAEIKGISDGTAVITARHSSGVTASVTVIVGDSTPLLKLECSPSELGTTFDGTKFDVTEFTLEMKLGNRQPFDFGSYTEEEMEKMTAKNISVKAELPNGLSFSKTSKVSSCMLTTADTLNPGCSTTYNKSVYIYNMPLKESEQYITLTVSSSNAPNIVKKLKIAVTESNETIITDLSEKSLTSTTKPKRINIAYNHSGDVIINSGVGQLNIKGNITINGCLKINGGTVNVTGSLSCDKIELKSGKLNVTGSVSCQNLEMSGGEITINGVASSLLANDIIAKNGEIKISNGRLATNNITLSPNGIGWSIDKSGGVITQTGGNIVCNNNFNATSNRGSRFTGGVLWIGGNFKHNEKNDNFQATDSHATVFFGGKNHQIDFDKGAKGKSYFNKLYIDNSYSSNRADYFAEYVRADFRKTVTDVSKYRYTTNGESLDRVNEWIKNMKATVNRYSEGCFLLAGDLTLAGQYTSNELKKLESIISTWATILSAPIIQQEFVQSGETHYGITLRNYAGKGFDLSFKTDGYQGGMFGSFSSILWYCEKLGVLEDSARIVGVTAYANIGLFKAQCGKYIGEEFAPEILSAFGRLNLKYAGVHFESLRDIGMQDCVGTLLFLNDNAGDIKTTISFFEDSASKSAVKSVSPLPAAQSAVVNAVESNNITVNNVIDIRTSDGASAVTETASNFDEVLKAYLGIPASSEISADIISSITSLDLSNSGLFGLAGIEKLTNLEVLDLSGNHLFDLNALAGLSKLSTLDLSDNKISVVSPLKSLTELKCLDLSGNFIDNIAALENLTGMYYLDISHNRITDLAALSNLTGLKYLDISDNTIASGNLSALSSLTGLCELYAANCGLQNVDAVQSAELTVVNLSNNGITSINELSLSNLKTALLSNNKLQSLAALRNSTKLRELDVSYNLLTDSSVSGTYNLLALERLNLRGNSLTSIEFIRSSYSLIWVDLCENEISSLSPLADKLVLRTLNASACGLTDETASQLEGVTSLNELNISNNNISSLDFVAELSQIAALDIGENPIEDISGNEILNELIDSGVEITVTDTEVKVEDIDIFSDRYELDVGEQVSLGYSVYPLDATNQVVTFTSSNEAVATVDENGLVTAISDGNAVITVTAQDGGYTDICTIQVGEHVHSYTAEVTAPTCTEQGYTTYTCSCGDRYIDNYVDATGHTDEDGDGICDICNTRFKKPEPTIEPKPCSCNCHKGGIVGFFFRFILFFQKIFGMNKICACGVNHY